MSTVVIKLGSSIVADNRGEVRLDVLDHITAQAAALHDRGDAVILVTSGAIARGMRLMDLPMRPSQMDELQAASAVGQGKLYRTYDELLAARGVPSAQVLLTFFDLSARRHYLNARATLERLLLWRVVPVINENDTTTTDEISFGDNDFLAAQVAVLMSADALLLLTDTDGVFTADPRIDPTASLIDEVTSFEQLEQMQIGVSTSPLGSGGMRSKVVASEMATAAGIPSWIVNGTRAGTIERALAGDREGTRFAPRRERASSFKLWLKYAKPTHGRIVVDDGAANALRDRGTSLLPVGIVEVQGEFEAGDAVEVCASNGSGPAIGKGIVNYSAEELRRIKGLKTAEVRAVLPRASEEAVHRDYFVLG
jgi:glutamate 5-kinase